MIQRKVPRSAERLPAIGLGTWRTFDVGRAERARAPLREVLLRLVESGGRMIDTSPMYGSAETVIGELVEELGLRDRVFLATKVWTRGKASGVWQMEESLRKLRVQQVDLIQVHNLLDADIHLETLDEWRRRGRVRLVGITHYERGGHELVERLMRSHEPDFIQVNYSPAEPEAAKRLLPLAQDLGIAVIANRPFGGGGLLRSLAARPLPDEAKPLGCRGWAQLLLKWIVADPRVTCAIPATASAAHAAENGAAGQEPLPDAALRNRIAEAVRG